MSRVVYRYSLPVDGEWHTFDLPSVTRGGRLLHVASRATEMIDFWVLNIPAQELVPREFRVFGTGEPMSLLCTHWGSAVDGQYVWHLFERTVRTASRG